MNRFEIEGNTCTIKINKTFYPEQIIQENCQDFHLEANYDGEKVVITSDKPDKLEKAANEFCDNLLSSIRGGEF